MGQTNDQRPRNPSRPSLQIAAEPQWVAWRLTPPKKPGAKPGKVPINPHTGRKASTTDPATWGTFEQARARAASDDLAGVGFVFRAEGGLAGVDLDGCRDPATGQLEPWAADIVRRLDSYAEASPTGTGVHILARGSLPPGKRRKGKIEMYDRDRFFTVTGARLPEAPAEIHERGEVLAALHAELLAPPQPAPKASSAPAAEATAPTAPPLDDDELLTRARAAANGAKFSALWAGDTTGYDSPSEADAALCCLLAFWTAKDAGRMDAIFRSSGLYRAKWDEPRGASTYGAQTIASAIETTQDVYTGPTSPAAPGDGDRDNLATRLVALVLASGAELFHDADGETYASLPRHGHVETVRLKDGAFSLWLAAMTYRELGRAVSANVQADALRTLKAHALFEGPEQAVHVRVAPTETGLAIDRGDPGWTAILVTPAGWACVDRSLSVFRRPGGAQTLPVPVRGGSITELFPFLNCLDGDRPLLLAWLVASLRPQGPFPVLALVGEQGSAKSTTARVLRALVDPNKAPLRTLSRSDRDLMVSAIGSWVLGFDNVSSIPTWMSDALCCVSTGAGFGARTLYTDDAETVLTASRPIVLTGIEDYIGRSDLLDRALMVRVPIIPKGRRQDEQAFWRRFRAAEGRILGALLDAMAFGLRRLDSVRLLEMPRMADFARWATACEAGLGLPDGEVLRALRRSADESVQVAMEASPVGRALLDLVEARGLIELTATELLAALNERRGATPEPHGWPKAANALSGQIKRLAPNLRALGIEVEFDAGRAHANAPRRLRLRKEAGKIVHIVQTVQAATEGPIPPRAEGADLWTISGTTPSSATPGSSTASAGQEPPFPAHLDDVDDLDDLSAFLGDAGEEAA